MKNYYKIFIISIGIIKKKFIKYKIKIHIKKISITRFLHICKIKLKFRIQDFL